MDVGMVRRACSWGAFYDDVELCSRPQVFPPASPRSAATLVLPVITANPLCTQPKHPPTMSSSPSQAPTATRLAAAAAAAATVTPAAVQQAPSLIMTPQFLSAFSNISHAPHHATCELRDLVPVLIGLCVVLIVLCVC